MANPMFPSRACACRAAGSGGLLAPLFGFLMGRRGIDPGCSLGIPASNISLALLTDPAAPAALSISSPFCARLI